MTRETHQIVCRPVVQVRLELDDVPQPDELVTSSRNFPRDLGPDTSSSRESPYPSTNRNPSATIQTVELLRMMYSMTLSMIGCPLDNRRINLEDSRTCTL